jgi:hypothetical protein
VVGLRRFFVTADKPSCCIKRTMRLREHAMNAWAARDARRLRKVDLLDSSAETGIFSAMLAGLSAHPCRIATL